jgi:hypothetical protein
MHKGTPIVISPYPLILLYFSPLREKKFFVIIMAMIIIMPVLLVLTPLISVTRLDEILPKSPKFFRIRPK